MSDLLKGISFVFFGILEGYAFLRSGLLNPQAVRSQMSFESFIVMKLFLSAVGSSMIAQSIMSMVSNADFEKTRKYAKSAIGYGRAVSGCALLGVGMSLSGSGPTLIPGQLGSFAGSSMQVFLGALVGGLLFGVLETILFKSKTSCQPMSVDGKLGLSYKNVAMPFGLTILAVACVLELTFPHASDPLIQGTSHTLLPVFAGIVVGLNQVPLRYLSGKGQGGSSSIMNILATFSNGAVSPRFKLSNIPSASQLLYVYVGTLTGAYLAVSTTSTYLPPQGVGSVRAFVGGVLMLFGARVADGCTCGHGISGFSELSVESMAAAMAIFVGGIASRFVLG